MEKKKNRKENNPSRFCLFHMLSQQNKEKNYKAARVTRKLTHRRGRENTRIKRKRRETRGEKKRERGRGERGRIIRELLV